MKTSTRHWLILTGCFIVALGANAFIIAPASVVPAIVSEYQIDYARAGFAVSAAILGMVVTQLPGGILMDRYDNRQLLPPALGVFTIAAFASLVADNYSGLLLSRFIGGMAAGFLFTLGTNIVGHVFAFEKKGFATSLFVASAPAGFALSQASGPTIAGIFGWKYTMISCVVVAFAGFVVFRAVAIEPVRTSGDRKIRELMPAFKQWSVIAVSLSAFCLYATYLFLNSWLPTFATTEQSLSLAGAGITSAVLPAVGVLARPAGGWVSDYIGRRRRPVIVASLIGVIPLFIFLPVAETTVIYVAMLVAGGFVLQFSTGVYYTLVNELTQSEMAGTSLTLFTTISYSGSLVSPIASGWLIETIGWGGTFATFIGVCLLGVVFLAQLPTTTK